MSGPSSGVGEKLYAAAPSRSRLFRIFLIWLGILAVCAEVRPLQMDEVFQLVGTDTPHLSSVFIWLHWNPASVPVGYLVQWALVRIAGASNFISRLPSLAAWALAVMAIMRVGLRAGLHRVETLVLLTAATPMLFRYAMEGRPYMPAFFLTALATLLMIEFIERPAEKPGWRLVLYGASLALALLFQGTAITVALAHAVFVLSDRSMRHDRRRQLAVGGTIALSLVLPVVWSLVMRHYWADSIVRGGYTFTFNLRSAYGFVKDISGGGVVCSGLLSVGACLGLMRASIPVSLKYLFGLTIGITVCGAVAADAAAGYFISARQAIYCLGAVIVLAASGWEWVRSRYPRAALAALGLFIVAALTSDVSVVRSKEDWRAATGMVAGAAAEGFCLQPASDINAPLQLYTFFDGSLEKRRCTESDSKVGLVYSTYTPRADRDHAAAVLTSRGFTPAGTQAIGGSTIERFILRPGAQ